MMEREEGLMHSFDEDKNVCAEHFEDPYLQTHINDNGHSGKCSYCGKRRGNDSSGLNVPPVSLSNVPGTAETIVPLIAETNVPDVSL